LETVDSIRSLKKKKVHLSLRLLKDNVVEHFDSISRGRCSARGDLRQRRRRGRNFLTLAFVGMIQNNGLVLVVGSEPALTVVVTVVLVVIELIVGVYI